MRMGEIVKKLTREEFEERIFAGGVYHFDFEKSVKELGLVLLIKQEWSWQNTYWSMEKVTEYIQEEMDFAGYQLGWRAQFDGKIPKSWLDWRDAMNDFIEVQNLGFQLSDNLINAGVTYPYNMVAEAVGISQRLNETQLTAILARPGMLQLSIDEIIEAQFAKGLTEDILRKAQARAEEIKRAAKNKMRNKNQLREPWPELSG